MIAFDGGGEQGCLMVAAAFNTPQRNNVQATLAIQLSKEVKQLRQFLDVVQHYCDR
jgi:hypothetical protein